MGLRNTMFSLNRQWKIPNMIRFIRDAVIIPRLYGGGRNSKLSCAFYRAKKNSTLPLEPQNTLKGTHVH
jgi:hypothetical protein